MKGDCDRAGQGVDSESSDEQSRTGIDGVAHEASRKEALSKLEGFNDPLRMRILTSLILRPSSANDLAAELEVPIGRIRYQLGRMRTAGLAELREQRPRRGVVERVYFIRPDFISIEDASHLTPQEMNRGNAEVLRAMVQDALAALRTGSLSSREDFVLARAPLRLDAAGWEQVSLLQHETLRRMLEIHASSSARIDRSGEEPIGALAFLLLFEAPPPHGYRKSSKLPEFESDRDDDS